MSTLHDFIKPLEEIPKNLPILFRVCDKNRETKLWLIPKSVDLGMSEDLIGIVLNFEEDED